MGLGVEREVVMRLRAHAFYTQAGFYADCRARHNQVHVPVVGLRVICFPLMVSAGWVRWVRRLTRVPVHVCLVECGGIRHIDDAKVSTIQTGERSV